MVPAKDLPGKKGGESSDGGNYMAKVISMCEPYDVPKSKKKTKKLAVWKGAKKVSIAKSEHVYRVANFDVRVICKGILRVDHSKSENICD